jgi:hypothetical protein
MRPIIVAGFVLVLAAGCRPPPKSPPPAPAAAEPPAPPPAPKCDTLDEGCVAADTTRSRIPTSSWTIAPPSKWKYAHGTEATVAKTDGAGIAFLVHEPGDKKTAGPKRSAALETVARQLGLTMPKHKVVWPGKPAKVMTVEALKVSLYQFGGFTLEGKAGELLVFTTRLPEGTSLLGGGFVLETDKTDADKAILTCLESLRHEPDSQTPDAGANAK